MVEIKNLTKRFGAFTAVDNVSFSVEKGEVLGFLGPNGAGKSTTMKMATGFLSPDGGSVTIGLPRGHRADAGTAADRRVHPAPPRVPVRGGPYMTPSPAVCHGSVIAAGGGWT